jgi:protein SCO1
MRLFSIITALALVMTVPAYAHSHEGHEHKPIAEVRDGGSRPDPDAKPMQVGGPFELWNQDGKLVNEKILLGKYSLIFFGFTYCPDICPTELQTALEAKAELSPAAAEKTQIIFITIDPARDTPKVIKAYLAQMSDGLIGLTGTNEQIATAAKAYKVYYAKAADTAADGKDYLMDHSGFLYLMGPDGQFLKAYAAGVDPADLVNSLKSLVKE